MIKKKKTDLLGQFGSFFITCWKKSFKKLFMWKNYFGGKKHEGLM
jgi:hypothetical protein